MTTEPAPMSAKETEGKTTPGSTHSALGSEAAATSSAPSTEAACLFFKSQRSSLSLELPLLNVSLYWLTFEFLERLLNPDMFLILSGAPGTENYSFRKIGVRIKKQSCSPNLTAQSSQYDYQPECILSARILCRWCVSVCVKEGGCRRESSRGRGKRRGK
ncbi:hypothetical protein ABVT39_013867, partial [Epinephelus coioides]